MSSGSKKQTIGYKYYAAIHMILCHGPVDYLKKILVDEDITLIEGNYPAGAHRVNKPNLFGGDKKQGGISGTITLMDGNHNQQKNPLVDSLQRGNGSADLVPAYRGVTGMFLSGLGGAFSRSGMYLGMNPYLKTWKTLVQRIYSTSDGSDQWYKGKAAIPSIYATQDRIMFQVAVDTSGSMDGNRLALVKVQLLQLLDFFALYAQDSNLDLSFLSWGTESQSYIERFSAKNEDIQAVRSWINGLTAAGGTDFVNAFRRADSFFQPNSIKSNAEKYMFFITDGIPDSETSVNNAVSQNSDLITKTGRWSPSPVIITGFNIDLDDTTYTRRVVNNGVYVIQSADDGGMVNAAQSAFTMAYWDMNPIHIIRECLTNEAWGNETPAYEIDNASFVAAADRIYQEGLGMSIKWTQEGSVNEFIQEVLRHINAVLYEDPRTGLITVKLIRDDYDHDTIPKLDEDEITSVSDFQKSAFSELINQVTVTFTDILTGADGTVTVQDTGLVAIQGQTNSKSVKYSGFSNITNAGRAGMRDLKSYATPLISAEITVVRSAGIDFRQGDVFSWSWKKYGVENVVMRIAAIGLGDAKDNKITLTCVQDIFSMPESTITTVNPEAPSPNEIKNIDRAIAYEIPYLELVQRSGESTVNDLLNNSPEVGFYGVAAARPLTGGVSLNAELYLSSLTTGNFLIDSTVNFCPNFVLNIDFDMFTNEIQIPFSSTTDFSLINVSEDLPILGQIGQEIISIYEISQVQESDILIKFKRGVLDTLPKAHSIGDTCYIWDVTSGASETQYADGETVIGKLVNQSLSASTELDDAMELPVSFDSRAYRPYPPANVKINGQYFPASIEAPLSMTWVDRNRLQQTGGDYIGWYDEYVTVENGVTYGFDMYDEDENLVISQAGITGTSHQIDVSMLLSGTYRIVFYSIRDGLRNYQDFNHLVTLLGDDFNVRFVFDPAEGYTPNTDFLL